MVRTVCVLLIIIFIACSNSEIPEPINKSHIAYGFYQIAKSGKTTVKVCESFDGKEIYPIDYTVIDNLAQGVFKIKQKSTGKEFLAVSFGEGDMIVTVKTCCWEVE